ncbi:MAG: TraB/GumN family protein [Pseudomonadota bacterium]
MKRLLGILLLVSSALSLTQSLAQPAAQQEPPEEVIVTGRLPGPALWRVSNPDDHVLWVFASLSPIPKDMVWESQRVEQVIAGADEYLEAPGVDGSVSPLVMLNPINYVRGFRLLKRLQANPDGKSLQEVLPPAMYQRFAALKAQYDPNNKDVDQLRPLFAVGAINDAILAKHDLVGNREIMKKVNRLVKRNRKLERTTTEVTVRLKGGYGDLADRAETLMQSLPLEQELACMERSLDRYENEIEEMKSRASSWAQGWIDDLRGMPLRGTTDDPCQVLIMASSEAGTVAEMRAQSEQAWLTAAEKSLANNESTFAILGLRDVLSEEGLLAKLKAKGYRVREP